MPENRNGKPHLKSSSSSIIIISSSSISCSETCINNPSSIPVINSQMMNHSQGRKLCNEGMIFIYYGVSFFASVIQLWTDKPKSCTNEPLDNLGRRFGQ